MPPTRGYTRAELLALRALPAASRYSKAAVRYAFASPCKHVLVQDLQGVLQQVNASVVQLATKLAPVLRYGRGIASLNLYPASKSDLDVNFVLWQVANSGEYHPAQWNRVLRANVFAVVMSEELCNFLQSVTYEQLILCILEVLALIAEDEDAEGLKLMQSELAPSIWNRLEPYMRTRPPANTRCSQTSDKLLTDVEILLRMCYLSPWKVDVYTSYITTADMATVLADTKIMPTLSNPSALVRTKETRAPLTLPHTRARAPSKNIVYWKLFLDWQAYRRVWVVALGMAPADAVTAMMNAVAAGVHINAWKCAETVLLCASRPRTKRNLLASLPKDLVYNVLAPHVLLASCAVDDTADR